MGIHSYKPTTPGRRFASVVDYSELSKKRPEKSLIEPKRRRAGRNAQGKITVRHHGGGHKKFYRIIDSLRERFDQVATVRAIEYDPNRTAWIALVEYGDGEKRYIIAPTGLKAGDTVVSSKTKAEIKTGNRLPLDKIPVGVMVHDLQFKPESKATIVRSAGSSALIQSVEGPFAQVKLPSGEIRMFVKECMATIGQVSNIDHANVRVGKAGKTRWRGVKPSVTGKSMNPVDHPHGGGEGHSPIGLKHPKTKWGKPAHGVKTRRSHHQSDKFIIKRRRG
ncbi:MAG: 50S ribosomal protein L2 [Candidatus Kerfeldbacteria bacterium]|nr:50S ribosomal protein L2 [Candidatus Kerfeldbacteria bacterium]